jgi:hypothetical protein
MIFVLAENTPTLFVFLTSEDASKLRSGLTLYVDPRMTGDRFFSEVILSQGTTKEEIVAQIRAVQPNAKIPAHLPEPPPREGEIKCSGCSGSNAPHMLFDGQCICCWAKEAKQFRTASN